MLSVKSIKGLRVREK